MTLGSALSNAAARQIGRWVAFALAIGVVIGVLSGAATVSMVTQAHGQEAAPVCQSVESLVNQIADLGIGATTTVYKGDKAKAMVRALQTAIGPLPVTYEPTVIIIAEAPGFDQVFIAFAQNEDCVDAEDRYNMGMGNYLKVLQAYVGRDV